MIFFLFEKKTTVECSSLYENRCMNIRKENVLVDSPEINNNDSRWHLNFTYLQVLRTTLSNRLAKVQGFLFRAAFLRRVPLFLRLISENILLCFLLSTMQSTSKYITGTLSLHFRKILTKLIHSRYFEVDIVDLYVEAYYIWLSLLSLLPIPPVIWSVCIFTCELKSFGVVFTHL